MEDIYRAYYTRSDPILNYMISMLSVRENMKVIEPCAGDGVFIERLENTVSNLAIDGYELNLKAVHSLKVSFSSNRNIKIIQGDTLLDENLNSHSNDGGIYDRAIGNPPYGGWQDPEKRQLLKKLYPGLYVKETYTLFLFRCIQLLREGGLLVFIVPDTFLNLHMHKALRHFLLTRTRIKEIALFPSHFFSGVNFGYSNLSIITLQKWANKEDCLANNFRVLTGFRKVEELENPKASHLKELNFQQQAVYDNLDHALFVSDNPAVKPLLNQKSQKIGDIADCVTGFYSGNDKTYLRPVSPTLRNAKNYQRADQKLICEDYLTKENLLEGIEGEKHFIPVAKGGGVKYYKPDLWYLDWGKKAVENYRTDKKARFQNSSYYFRFGIGIPMVSSSRITAALIENKIFDQSIVGVFPKEEKWLYYLLAFFNSPTCNKLIRTLNPSANNPANYIKKLPFLLPSAQALEKINCYVMRILTNLKEAKPYPEEWEVELHRMISELYGF